MHMPACARMQRGTGHPQEIKRTTSVPPEHSGCAAVGELLGPSVRGCAGCGHVQVLVARERAEAAKKQEPEKAAEAKTEEEAAEAEKVAESQGKAEEEAAKKQAKGSTCFLLNAGARLLPVPRQMGDAPLSISPAELAFELQLNRTLTKKLKLYSATDAQVAYKV
jgi:hypothetical protein